MTSQTDPQVKLLIVDDNPDDRFLYKRLLNKVNGINWSILESESGEDGLELCKNEAPDCVLLDYILPDIDGLEFLLQMKKMSVGVPVIMLTGQGDETVAVLAMKEGAKDYLAKDVLTPASLKGTILNCMKASGKSSTPDWDKKEKVELISEIQTLERKLALSSGIDALTGLPNRRSMVEKLYHEKNRFERIRKPFAMVMADIDEFNVLCASHGPEVEKEILNQVGRWLDFNTRKQDVVCHWGNKRFVLLLPETESDGVDLFIEKLCAKIEQEKFMLSGKEIGLTMSFSSGVYNNPNLKIEDCIQQADECLIQ
jgi:diguanylate cyclase (GGDEF)-like protein